MIISKCIFVMHQAQHNIPKSSYYSMHNLAMYTLPAALDYTTLEYSFRQQNASTTFVKSTTQ